MFSFSEDPQVPEDIRQMLRAMGVEILGDDEILQILVPYLRRLEELCQTPDETVDHLEEQSHLVGEEMAELVASTGENLTDLLPLVQEWTLYAVALCVCTVQGAWGDPRGLSEELSALAGKLPELNLGLIGAQQNQDLEDQTILDLVSSWMECRGHYQSLLDQLGPL